VQHHAGARCERCADETRAARTPMKKKRQITARVFFMGWGFGIRDPSEIPKIRAEFKRAGRSALARIEVGGWSWPPLPRSYLKAPKELVEIAGYLWRNEPMIIFERKSDAQPNAKPAATKYLEQFTLKYSHLGRTRSLPNDLSSRFDTILKMYLAKNQSDVRDRWRKAIKRERVKEVDGRAVLRETLIKSAYL